MYHEDQVDSDYKTRQIRRVVSKFYEEFTTYLATAVSLTETIPEEVNNQVRNAFTHLCRALDTDHVTAFNQEVEKSLAHLERANRDCLKVAIIGARKELDNLVADAYIYYGAVTPRIEQSRSAIIRRRSEIYKSETQGAADVNEKMLELVNDTIDLSNAVKLEFIEVGTRKIRIIRFAKRWSRPVWGLVGGAIGTAIGALLRPYIPQLIEYMFG